MEYYGKGPLLSAKELDIEVAWERARQMQHACEEVHILPFEGPHHVSLRTQNGQKLVVHTNMPESVTVWIAMHHSRQPHAAMSDCDM